IERKVKFLACEFGYDQKVILKQILCQKNFQAEFFQDEQGYDRAFVAQFTKK
ncbi:peptide chain release factor N(5)-glutamine methyltransferase, partial [Campylobacter coli]|nr:peptide chain release factor N(5)-glutamine methyltransferase [Campylobacter coli]